MVGRHHWLNRHEFKQVKGVSEREVWCPWGRKELGRLSDWPELNWGYHVTAKDTLAFWHKQPGFKQTHLEFLQETIGWVERGAQPNSSFQICCAVWERGLSFLEMSLNPSNVAPEVEREAGQEPGSESQGPGLEVGLTWSAGVQPWQDPGEPSGWTASARERHVGPALIGPSLLGRERERKKETRPGICSRVSQLLYFSPSPLYPKLVHF